LGFSHRGIKGGIMPATPYIGNIILFGGTFAPVGWLFCQGQLLPISQYDTLFALIGTTYGGDGQTTFAVPDLRSRVPIHQGQGPGLSNYIMGQAAGTETVTVTPNQMPIHTHSVQVSSSPANTGVPSGTVTLGVAAADMYIAEAADVSMHPQSISSVGGSQPHDNIQPYLALNYIIATEGIFPPQ
jgi:microcystin-dependent protein